MREHVLQWVAASPLWGDFMPTPDRMKRPALLRFATDDFMDELNALLQRDPASLFGLLAKWESFREPLPGPAPAAPAPPPIKLYQPIHGHFNLVAASLVCQLAGLPDHGVDAAKGEKVGFVLRRYREGNPDKELAWADAPGTKAVKGWKELADPEKLDPSEEVFPMFPVGFRLDGKNRRLFAGLVPTASRDVFEAAPVATPDAAYDEAEDPLPPDAEGDPRFAEAKQRVLEPLEMLQAPSGGVFGTPSADAQAEMNKREKEASLFLLLDLADILFTHLGGVFQALREGTTLPAGDAAQPLRALLASAKLAKGAGSTTWATALIDVWDHRAALMGDESAVTNLDYDVRATNDVGAVKLSATALSSPLEAALAGHKPSAGSAGASSGTAAEPLLLPKLGARAGGLYVLRCVYQRPRCGALHPDAVSARTEPFTIASFFDVDAPARSIRILLPVDTSIAGLRKFKKSVGFVLSDELRRQMSRVTDLKKVLDGNLGNAAAVDLGVIWSFSIPIITICALIVLMIFAFLLNIVFFWLPFLKIAIPIKLKAK
jgi:hypothetical protein